MDPLTGRLILDRYRLGERIAKGGMGSVWSGVDEKLRRAVAIKVLHPKWGASPEARMRFEREAMAVAQLNCPYVVQVFDYGNVDGAPVIVMELMTGEDLQARLKRVKRLSLSDTATIIWQTAKALGVAHGAGIVHRDLKPGNIFLVRGNDDEAIKVCDFGVAKLLEEEEGQDDERTREGVIVGTPHYMSPEQARGVPGTTDHRSDLWSLGVIAYRALTGKLPYRGRTATDVIVKILTRKPYVQATDLRPDIHTDIDHFFAKAFSFRRENRFQSAREMAAAFQAVAEWDGSAIPMPPLSFPEVSPELFDVRIIEDAPISTIDTAEIRARIVLPDLPHDTMSSLTDSTMPPASQGSLNGVQLTPPAPVSSPRRRSALYVLAAMALGGASALALRSTLHEQDAMEIAQAGVAAAAPSITLPVPRAIDAPSDDDPPVATRDENKPKAASKPRPRARPRGRRAAPAPKATAPAPKGTAKGAKPVDPFAERL